MLKYPVTVFLFAIMLFAPQTAIAKDDVTIDSNRFELDTKQSTMSFSGQVRITYGPYKATCDRATVYTTKGGQSVDRIQMSGGVTITRNESIFRGQSVTLYPQTGKIVVEGGVQTRIKLPL